MDNHAVASILSTIADLLDLRGDMPFKIRAYRMAAQTLETLEEDVTTLVHENRLRDIPGIGEALAKKITELVQTGKLEYFENLKKETPPGLVELLLIPGLGPRKVAAMYSSLGVATLEDLKKAATEGRLRDLKGFGETTERNILRGIQLREKTSGRVLLFKAFQDGASLLSYLKTCPDVVEASTAGSLRRMRDTIGDVDLLATSQHPHEVVEFFTHYPLVETVLAKGETKGSVLLIDGLQVDLRVVAAESYGAALQYFTGSKDHNVALRSRAIRMGYKLNEYGLFSKETDRYVAGRTEAEVYQAVGLPYIAPELRENRGELEAAAEGRLPELVGYEALCGDFHMHSEWSDGNDSIETLARTAQSLGYSFIGVTDHSQSLKIANGLSEDRVRKKLEHIRDLQQRFPDVTILCGTECDIKTDGTLDYSAKTLKSFDFVYGAIHSSFKMDTDTMTRRIVAGIEHEEVDFLAHPTGRLIGKREPYAVDVDRLLDAAVETGTLLEINAFPDRLDLDDVHVKQAKERGVQFVLGTDSHNATQLGYMRYGVATARRGWLEASDILNTRSVPEIRKFLEAA